jgi:hypothetical protein
VAEAERKEGRKEGRWEHWNGDIYNALTTLPQRTVNVKNKEEEEEDENSS